MRIVGGEFRGRPLAAPRDSSIRPTTDRTREAVFNVIAHRFAERLQGARVLDLFAGTGALGLEALSRGAAHCVFIEESAQGRGLIRDNVEALGLQGRTKIFRRDATVLEFARRNEIPIVTTMSGGYAADINDTVEIHCNTIRAVKEVFFDFAEATANRASE